MRIGYMGIEMGKDNGRDFQKMSVECEKITKVEITDFFCFQLAFFLDICYNIITL